MSDLSRATVMVAEDVELSRRMTATMLERLGVGTVIEVDNGRTALDRLTAGDQAIHLVIADIDMPRIDGLTLAQKIANGDEGANPRTPVVMLTSKDQPQYRQAAAARGVVAYMEKPATLDGLRKVLADVLSGD